MANYSVKQLNFTKDGNTYTITGETYENKAAASGGTAVSLVTTGDKYNWNNKANAAVASTSENGLMSASDKTKLDGITAGATANVGTITGITMNGASKGTSGVVNLGTVLTAHQDISGKIDKPNGVAAGKFLQTNSSGNAVWGDAASAATISQATSDWLAANVPSGTTIAIDRSLSTDGAAANASTVGLLGTTLHDNNKLILSNIIGTAIDLNSLSWTHNAYINASGVITSGDSHFKYSELIPIDKGYYYIYARKVQDGSGKNIRIHGYNSSGAWVKQITYFIPYNLEATEVGFEVDSTVTQIRISSSDFNEIPFLVNDNALKNKTLIYRKQLTSSDDIHQIDLPGMYYISGNSIPANMPFTPASAENHRLLVIKSSNPTSRDAESHILISKNYLWIEMYTPNGWTAWRRLPSYNNEVAGEAIMLGLHTMPENRGVLNAIKRARQQTDIVWTAGSDIPRGFLPTGETYLTSYGSEYMGTFKKDSSYTGLAYTELNYIGSEIPIDSFVTSAKNSRSVMALESPATDSNHACYYGAVCTSLVSYALNIPTVHSRNWMNMSTMHAIGNVNGFDLKNLQLADILRVDGHVAIVTDIVKNDNGDVILVEVSEATRMWNPINTVTNGKYGGLAKRTTMTAKRFLSWFDGFTVVRYDNLSTIPYCPNSYSPLPGEGNFIAYDDLPCVPYLGDKISLSTEGNRQIKILINTDQYTHMIVKKDGTPWNQNGTTNAYSISGLNEITITCDDGFAVYTASLATYSNGSISSSTVACTWAVRPTINPTITVSNNKANFSYTVKGDSFTPWYVCFGTSWETTNNNTRGGYAITVYDKYTVVNNGNGTYTYTFSVDYPATNNSHVSFAIISDEFGFGRKDLTI